MSPMRIGNSRVSNRPWYKSLLYLMVVIFTFASYFATAAGHLRAIGMVLVFVFICSQGRKDECWRSYMIPAGIWSYLFWGIWVCLTGLVVSVSMPWFLFSAKTLIQSIIMIFIVYCALCRRRHIDLFYWAIILASAIHIAALMLGYENTKDFGIVDAGGDDFEHERVRGLTGNQNGLGDFIYLGCWGAMMMWPGGNGIVFSFLKKALLTTFILVAISQTPRTGSRQTMVILGILVFGWLVYALPCVLRRGFRWLFGAIACIGVICAISSFSSYIMENTVLGERLRGMEESGQGSMVEGGKNDIRYALYQRAFELFSENPIVGVGFGQFVVRSKMGLFTHSDYMEPLVCTGIVGFLLYHLFAFGALLGILKCLKYGKMLRVNDLYVLRMLLLFMIVHYLSGLFAPHWYKLQKVLIVSAVYATIYRIRIEYCYEIAMNRPHKL